MIIFRDAAESHGCVCCDLVCPFVGIRRRGRNWKRATTQENHFGLFIHDRGPTSDKHEGGVDPNWEIQFNGPDWKLWQWIGAPFPMVGLTPNFNGDTSVFYGGLTYEISLSNRFLDELTQNLTKKLFIAGSVSLALHDGPLHKREVELRTPQ
jgi:hypothetical protein